MWPLPRPIESQFLGLRGGGVGGGLSGGDGVGGGVSGISSTAVRAEFVGSSTSSESSFSSRSLTLNLILTLRLVD